MKKELRKGWNEMFLKAKENNPNVFDLTEEDLIWLSADLGEEEINFREITPEELDSKRVNGYDLLLP